MLNIVNMPKKDSTLRTIELIKEKGISPKEIHQATSIKYNTITNALGDNNRNFTIEQISEICEAFNFNQTYCVFGKGEKYGYKASDKIETKENLNLDDVKEIAKEILDKDRTISYLQSQMEILNSSHNEAMPIQQDVVYIPLVNQFAYAGYIDGYTDTTYMEQLPKIPFIVDKEGHGNYIAFEVKGDSMNNGTEESYLEGDRLYCREIQPHLWVSSKLHLRKWDFVIVHTDGIIVKRIINHDVENHTITIHSLNDMYPDRVIDLCEVKQIFNVIESVRPRRR